jgi:hypothetical protein
VTALAHTATGCSGRRPCASEETIHQHKKQKIIKTKIIITKKEFVMITPTNKNKGGAPKKAVLKNKEIKFSCTEEVYDFFVEQSQVAGYATQKRSNVSKFLHDFTLTMIHEGYYQSVQAPKVSRDLLLELVPVANNLNQAMHVCNTAVTDLNLVDLGKKIEAIRRVMMALTTTILAPKVNIIKQGE